MFDYKDLTIAVVGGGVSGSYIACMLAKDGYRVSLFRPENRNSQPSPMLLFPRTYLSFLMLKVYEDRFDAHDIDRVRFLGLNGEEASVTLEDPLTAVNPQKVSDFLCQVAEDGGAKIFPKEVQNLWEDEGFILEAEDMKFGADFLVGADGIKSKIRTNLLKFESLEKNSQGQVQAFLPGVRQEDLVVKFLPNIPGYFWIMPHSDGALVGLRELNGKKRFDLLAKLLHKFSRHYFGLAKTRSFTPQEKQIPILSGGEFEFQRYMGPNWALVGSAAGLVNPLTGLGSTEAILSAYYFCDSFCKVRPSQYPGMIKDDVYLPLDSSLNLMSYFCQTRSTNFFISFLNKSPRFAELVGEVLSGKIKYNQAESRFQSQKLFILFDNLLYNFGKKPRPRK